MGSARINAIRQRMALTLNEHVKSKMTDFMKRQKRGETSNWENELFGDMMNENSKSKMMLLTNLEATRDDRVLKPEDRDEEGYITNALGDTQGIITHTSNPAESGLDTMNQDQVDYNRQKLLRRSTTNTFSRDEAEKKLKDIAEGRGQKSNKPILSTYTQSARIQTARQRLADIFDVVEGGKIKPTKFLTPRGEASSVGHSFKTKTTPKNYLNLTHAGWSTTDDFSTSNIRPQGTKGIHKPSGWGEKGKEIFRGDERGSVEFIRRKIRRGDPIVHPSLNVFSPGDVRTKAEAQDIVAGHAGRHRARALHEEGVKEMPVSVFSTRKDKDLVPTKLPTTPEEGLDIGWYSEGQKTIDEMKHGPRPVSARIQMARERLGAVGKISNLNDKMISKARYKGKDFPQVSKGMGSGAFLTPDGTFVGTNDHAQTVLDTDYKYNKFVTEKGGSYSRATTQWLRDSGAYRLRGIYPDYTKNRSLSGLHIEGYTEPTKQQIKQLTKLRDQVGSENVDWAGVDITEKLGLGIKKPQERTHTEMMGAKLRQRLGVISPIHKNFRNRIRKIPVTNKQRYVWSTTVAEERVIPKDKFPTMTDLQKKLHKRQMGDADPETGVPYPLDFHEEPMYITQENATSYAKLRQRIEAI